YGGAEIVPWPAENATSISRAEKDIRPEDRLVFEGDQRALALLAREVNKDQAAPSVWIGLRLTPLPAALAAHVGDQGMMIANVAARSPSSDAGLKQYDVLQSINGNPVSNMDEVIRAMAAVAPGEKIEITILRKGKAQSQTIESTSRPVDPAAVEYLYVEPAPDFSTMDVRGKRLQLGPNGQWQIEDLGPMSQPLATLPGLERFDLKNWNQWTQPHMMAPLPNHGFDDLSDLDRWRMFLPPHGTVDSHETSELSISVSENDETFSVQRHADGSFDIEVTDADGNVEKSHFDDENAFSTQKPEAYQRYRELAPTRTMVPGWNGGGDPFDAMSSLPQDMRQRMQLLLQRAHDLDRNLQLQRFNGPSIGNQNMTSIQIIDEKITIRTNENGELHTYEFDSPDQMKSEAPDVYERVRSMFE
ncbi:MAG: S1C family serine protease, partial [Phycisphaerae bacterium]